MRAYFQYIDLLDMPIEYTLVNFISKDFKVNKGTDTLLENVFHMKGYVKNFYKFNKKIQYPCAIYYPAYNLQPVINLVCKKTGSSSIEEENVVPLIKSFALICKIKKLKYVAMPYAEPWEDIESALFRYFRDLDITIVVSIPNKKKRNKK